MKKVATDLTDTDREAFADAFYSLCPDDRDGGNPCPWGCPWTWGGEVVLEGDSVEEMARKLFIRYADEIADELYRYADISCDDKAWQDYRLVRRMQSNLSKQ